MPTNLDLANLRRDYRQHGLLESDLDADPVTQFGKWLAEAVEHELMEPNAMTLSTVDAEGQPWSRTVLLKACDTRGFIFFTNYEGAKARQLANNPRCALTFWWAPHERQVNVTGHVERIPRAETEAYFATRPAGSRIGAWASKQSEIIASREPLERGFEEMRARLGENPPAPEHWGGYVVVPATIEFWQGRASRLHDRLRYCRDGEKWRIERLSP